MCGSDNRLTYMSERCGKLVAFLSVDEMHARHSQLYVHEKAVKPAANTKSYYLGSLHVYFNTST